MHFSMRTLEVDGSLQNPIVVLTVLTWSCVLALATAALVRSTMRRQRDRRPWLLICEITIAVLYLATPIVQFLIGTLYYRMNFAGTGVTLVSVGFWGGPPVLPSWVLGALVGLSVLLRSRRRAPVVRGVV